MKKILAWVLVLVMALGMFAGCNKQEPAPTTEPVTVPTTSEEVITAQDAIEYLKALYPKTEEVMKTPVNFERPGIVRVGGIPFTVVWTTDLPEEQIKVVVSEENPNVTIDVNEQCEVDTPYVLTATITDDQGNTAFTTWNCLLPEAVDMASIVKEAYALKSGESLPYVSTLRGKIVSIDTVWNPEYKNITVTIAVEGAEDMPIQCYRLKGEGAEKLAVGNIITVTGTLKNYNGTIEFDAGCTLDVVEQGDAVEAPSDPGEILKAAYKLKKGKSLPYPVTLTGKVTSIDKPFDPAYNNISVVITVDGYKKYPILCYRLKGAGAEDIALEDTITVTGIIKNYEGTIEFDAGCQLVERISGGNTAQKPTDDEDKILRDAKKLKDGEKLPYVAILTGQVFSVDDKYNSEYGNITVTMKVGGTRIKAYRLKGDDVQKVKVGDTITVSGQIENYQGIIEFGSGCTMTDRKAGSGKLKVELGPVDESKTYYAEMKQATLGKNLYFNGKISSSNYLQTTEDPTQAVQIHVEEVSGKGTRFYFLEGETKKYIEIMTVEVSGEKKQRTTLVTEPTAYWNYDSEYKVYFFDADGVYCALGTYSTNNSISATKLGFLSTSNIGKTQFVVKYVTEPSEAPEKPDAPAGDGTIAAAVAGNDGDLFTVTGVITLVDGSNVYLQDATGGICVRFPSRIDGFQLGHVIKATGTRATYNTLPQLAEATYEVASGIDLVAKETTIGALKTKDIGTYIKLTGVTVTEIFDNNGAYTSPNITVKDSSGKTIQLYKAVVGKTGGNWDVKVGDKLNVYAAVSVHNNKLQLRNTYATEIAINPAQPVLHTPTAPAPVPEGSDPETPPVGPNPPATDAGVLNLTVDSLGIPADTYYTGAATVEGINFDLTQIGNYGSGIQMRDKDGKTSILFNTNAMPGKITKIELTFNSEKSTYDNPDAVIFSFGAAQDNLTYTTKLSTSAGEKNYTITPEGDNTFFKIEHDLGYSMYWDSIKVYYEATGTEPQPPVGGDNVLTIPEAIAMGSVMAQNTFTTEKYTVTGVIDEIYNTTYGNLYIKDAEGNRLKIYGLYDSTGDVRFDAMATKPAVGDTITVLGVMGNYNGAQMKDGWLQSLTPGTTPEQPPVTPDEPVTPPATNDGVLELTVDTLGIPTDTYHTGTATVEGINFDLTQIGNYGSGIQMRDKDGKTSILFNTNAMPGKITKIELTFNAGKSTYDNPDAVIFSFGAAQNNLTYTTKLSTSAGEKNYTITPEGDNTFFKIEHDLGYSMYWDSIKVYYEATGTEPEQPPVTPDEPVTPPAGDDVLTIPEAIAMGSVMAQNTFTTEKYTVTGVIDEIYNATYGNLYIKDAEGNRLKIYGLYDSTGDVRFDAMATKPAVGDTITVLGVMGNYNGAQMKDGWLQSLTPGTTPEQPPVTPDEPVTPPATNDGVLELTVDTLGIPADTYQTGAATVEGINFDLTQIGNYGSGIQMRDKDGKTSVLFNTNALPGKITKIELTFSSAKSTYNNPDAVIFSFGAAQNNLTYTTKLSTSAGEKNYTITPEGDNTFFKIEHDLGYTMYWDSIKVYYEATGSNPGTNPEQPPVVTPPATTGDGVLELTVNTLGIPTDTYHTGTATVEGINFDLTQIGNYGSGIQMRDKDGKTSILFNTNALPGKITKIELTFSSAKSTYDNPDAVIFSFGAAQNNLTYTTKLSTSAGEKNYTITPEGNNTFFKIEHDLGYSMYWDSIKVYYEN